MLPAKMKLDMKYMVLLNLCTEANKWELWNANAFRNQPQFLIQFTSTILVR